MTEFRSAGRSLLNATTNEPHTWRVKPHTWQVGKNTGYISGGIRRSIDCLECKICVVMPVYAEPGNSTFMES